MVIQLPISKSIANRILLLQAIHGDPLMRVSTGMPDDVVVLHDALEALQEYQKSKIENQQSPLVLHLKNCGTALRFLQVHLEQCYPGEPIELTGDERLMERKGKPTSQIDSARILHGLNVPVQENESPYITMSRELAKNYSISNIQDSIEADWSAAAFWYEYVAIHGGVLLLEGLKRETLQGDKMVASLYSKYFGVITSYTDEGAKIYKSSFPLKYDKVSIDFENIPDLYPAIAFTCERLHITLEATGTSRLRFKESNRLTAVRLHEVRNDHRMAMALMCADFPVSKEEQGCIGKSYPQFEEYYTLLSSQNRDQEATTSRPSRDHRERVRFLSVGHITPIKGVNDEGKGKKFALGKLIHGTDTDYLWMHDDDIIRPKVCSQPNLNFVEGQEPQGDLIILPLKMESENEQPSLLERLQIAEYAAIQEVTMQTAKSHHAVMCSGANLIVKRKVWLACEPELHPEIPSGDDMFLLEAVKRKGYTVGVIDEEEYTAIVRPATNWRAFWRQRMRWAGKAPHYTDKDILDYGKFIVVANVLQILFFPIILIKFPYEYGLIKARMNKNHQSPITNHKLFLTALLLEILYPFYLLICLIGGMNNKKEW